ncbi:hypothetical protein FIA78_13670 [Escherichia coli]|nr:hypothetical protein [Escherichia coli]QCH48885.1 hypothetical protein C8202_22780 [Escherichia coli O113:H21]EEV5970656.1 hypothetical protein [Escherichia coli]EEV5994481.1 hypothetical protein [Escherichia coli]EEV7558193.1 hypothetical protein [Escherichia coli]
MTLPQGARSVCCA